MTMGSRAALVVPPTFPRKRFLLWAATVMSQAARLESGAAMAYWLMKSEPEAFSIDDLARLNVAPWDGVRNFQARNNLRAMKAGDLCFFYHSSTEPPGVVGVARVAKEAYPDHTAWNPGSKYHDPRSTPEKPVWFMPDVEFVEKFPRIVTLAELRETPGLEAMALLKRGQRLSVQPVGEKEWEIVLGLAHEPPPDARP
jgi:predicted RNA-binding protein with PUA-like domain